jgi:hypothetical protein
MSETIKDLLRHKNEMKEIGLDESTIHPVEVYVIATHSNIANPYRKELFFDKKDAVLLKNVFNDQQNADVARVFKVSIKLNGDENE